MMCNSRIYFYVLLLLQNVTSISLTTYTCLSQSVHYCVTAKLRLQFYCRPLCSILERENIKRYKISFMYYHFCNNVNIKYIAINNKKTDYLHVISNRYLIWKFLSQFNLKKKKLINMIICINVIFQHLWFANVWLNLQNQSKEQFLNV